MYKGLLYLSDEYRNVCLGQDGAKTISDKKLKELEIRLDGSISQQLAAEQGDEYFVRFPTSASPKRFLEWHLRKGKSKEARYCMAIYFFWDEDTSQIVVGWLPSHLDNRMT